jgi:3-phenylpropionate/trans-cinnamate dioxygenase ferredoxin reductase component
MSIAIVGAGLAAVSAVEELRAQGYDGDVAVFGSEDRPPYHRPPLSKAVLLGEKEPESAFVHDEEWYAEHKVELHLGEEVRDLDLDGATLRTASGQHRFDRLLVATGSAPRRLPAADDSGAPVAYLRTMEESRLLRAALVAGQRLVIVGAGWIGLEVAAAAITAGCSVTVVETLPLPLFRVLGERVATVFADLHRAHGVDLRLGASVDAIASTGNGVRLTLGDGESVAGDLLVVGIGVQPNVAVAQRAGLVVENGIVTDPTLRTLDPRVWAAGDVANHLHPVLGRRIRVEHWDTAIEQGKVAARNLLGAGEEYRRLPYFFTDQYDLGMEYVGSVGPDGFDDVVLRGSPADGTFAAFWLRGGVVLAGMHVNDWDAIDPIRALVGGPADPGRLADTGIALAELAAER